MSANEQGASSQAAAVAAKLTKAQRESWIWTILAVVDSRPNRRAFADGYNGNECERPRTERKMKWHERGLAVRAILHADKAATAEGGEL